jgi:hypothetical protein
MVRQTTSRARWKCWALLLLAAVALNFGCAPLQVIAFFWPGDTRFPPRCPLADENNKEVKLVVMASFSSPSLAELDELRGADQALAERMIRELKQHFDQDKKKVTIVPYYLVKSYLSRSAQTDTPYEVGKHFKADKVLTMEINDMSLYAKGSDHTLYLGKAAIRLTVMETNVPSEEGVRFDENYICEYPKTAPVPVDGNLARFRSIFLDNIAKGVAHYFTPYDTKDRLEMGDSEVP